MVSWRYLVSLPAAILLLFGGLTLKVSDQRALAFEMSHNQGPLTLSLAVAPLSLPSSEPKNPIREQMQKSDAKRQPEAKPLREIRPAAETNLTVQTKSPVKTNSLVNPTPEPAKSDLNSTTTEQSPTAEPVQKIEPSFQEMASDASESYAAASAPVWVDKPKFMARPKAPYYPGIARRRGMEGVVMIEVLFNRFGEQLSLAMVESSGFGILDDAALAAVREWQFAVPSEDGDQFKVRVPVRFNLN